MRTSYWLAALAVLVATGSPALAQQAGGPTGPGSRYGLEPTASRSSYDYGQDHRQNRVRGRTYNRSNYDRDRSSAYDQGGSTAYNGGYYPAYDQGYYRDYGFNPLGAAAGIVGGAVGTAGAIATAPFRAFDNRDSYAMAQGESYCAQRYRSYDPASGTFMGYDGRRHPCP